MKGLFGFGKKPRKKAYVFDAIDREVAETIRARKAKRKLETLNALDAAPQQSNSKNVIEQLREFREFAEEMGYTKGESSSDGEMMSLMTQFLAMNAAKQNPVTTVKNEIVKKLDIPDQIISNIPADLRERIEKGQIPKIMAKKWMDSQFETVWKRLNTRKKK